MCVPRCFYHDKISRPCIIIAVIAKESAAATDAEQKLRVFMPMGTQTASGSMVKMQELYRKTVFQNRVNLIQLQIFHNHPYIKKILFVLYRLSYHIKIRFVNSPNEGQKSTETSLYNPCFVTRRYAILESKEAINMKLGVFVRFGVDDERRDIRQEFQKLHNYGFSACQLGIVGSTVFSNKEVADIRNACEEFGIEITAVWCLWKGPAIWNFTEGPATLGIVPEAYRQSRIEELKCGCELAVRLGVTDVITHMGFIPENPCTTEYRDVVAAIRYLAEYFRNRGRYLLFETGQETPVTLLRTIEQVGTGNLGINLDTANLIAYGKANPVDALDVFGKYVRNTHMKDGLYPTDGMNLGKEVPIGEGKVDFKAVIEKLKELNYNGPLIIEREIKGERQIKDILAAKSYLEGLL